MHKYSWLRKVRVVLSLVFLVITGILFLDQSDWLPSLLRKSVTWLQFVPSLLKFTAVPGMAAAGFLLVLLLTLLSGRIYCAGVCPLGVVQDLIFRLRKRLLKKKPLNYTGAGNLLRYGLLLVVIVSVISGTSFLLSLLDPYSIFGKMMSNLIRPLFLAGSNGISALLENADYYVLSKVTYKGFYWAPFLFSAIFLMLVAGLSWYRGRLFCNTLCPVGALLGILSKFSLLRISLSRDACSGCGHCSRVCKAQCIDIIRKEVDTSRCVTCFNCLDVCPSDGVVYGSGIPGKQLLARSGEVGSSKQRRDILKAILITSAFIPVKAMATRVKGGEKPTRIPDAKKHVPSPPGSVSHEAFHRRCTACHLCVSVCPTQVLQPSLLQYGLQGFLQPAFDNHAGFCNYECTLCSEVCPTGAIMPLDKEQKKLTQVGVARFIKENCVVYTDNTDCGACSEHCPTKAVDMVPYKGRLTIPLVNDKTCVGCGACEYACPTTPFRAIYVEGHQVHRLAEKPPAENIILRETSGDFPF